MREQIAPLSDGEFEQQRPKPVGYHLLVALPQVSETYEGTDIQKTPVEKHNETIMSIVGLVMDIGSTAYLDKERFPTGPWCKEGDYVLFRANSGTRFKIEDVEYRLMNDDSIEAVVPDPRGITRA
jgi:co-chaperonin GroES (HSP10)|tara:strand:- start:8738 stop:9112 length:375 start_codon:yes stop_codon:yes gene_type:complete